MRATIVVGALLRVAQILRASVMDAARLSSRKVSGERGRWGNCLPCLQFHRSAVARSEEVERAGAYSRLCSLANPRVVSSCTCLGSEGHGRPPYFIHDVTAYPESEAAKPDDKTNFF